MGAMNPHFPNRFAAGQLLAEKLARYAGRPGLIVLALPRGGVPVAAEVAHRLQAPLDVLVVRKLGAPVNPEFALGAVASGGLRVLNARALTAFSVKQELLDGVSSREVKELNRRELAYRHGRPELALPGRPVILIDDGIATGSTMRVAVAAVRAARAGPLIVAAPVAARESYLELRADVQGFVALCLPRDLGSVGEYYEDFEPVTDAEVRRYLDHAWQENIAMVSGPA